MKLELKRAYELPTPLDGVRVLVDRLWPRGLSKAKACIEFWTKEVAPSNELRHWYQHELERWPEFRLRYLEELKNNTAAVKELIAKLGNGNATLLFSSKELKHHSSVVLKECRDVLVKKETHYLKRDNLDIRFYRSQQILNAPERA